MDEEKMNGEDWKRSESGFERGDSLKEGPWVIVRPTGASEAGAEATQMAIKVAQARGLGLYDWAWEFYGSSAKGQIRGVPVALDQTRPGACLVRWYQGKGSPRAAWHMGGVFKDFKDLRPKSNVRCRVIISTGSDGLPVLLIPIKATLSTQTTHNGSPGSQAAAGENPSES